VKLFFFKKFFQYFGNYSESNVFIKKDKEFPFREEHLNMIQNQETKLYILNHNFLPMNNRDLFIELKLEFLSTLNNNFSNINKLLNKEFISNNDGFDFSFAE